MKRILFYAVMFFFVTSPFAWGEIGDHSESIILAEAAKKPIPLVSLLMQGKDIETAYEIQKRYVTRKLTTDRMAGLKAGLTTKASQARFGLDSPVAGVLFESGRLENQAVVEGREFRQLMIETELSFVVTKAIRAPVSDVASLRDSITVMAPAVELPDLGFEDMGKITGVDVVAANVSARRFLLGAPRSLEEFDPNKISVVLYRNGEKVYGGYSSDVMGDQWLAALWLVNKMLAQGWVLEPGQVLLTGAIGNMALGKPGRYLADYGEFGRICFEIR